MTTFMLEDREQQRKRLFALVVLVAIALVGAYTGLKLFGTGVLSFETFTPLTIFLAGAASGLFFLPVPLEVLFFTGVKSGSPPVLTTIAVITGFVLGNVVSYLIGWKLSRLVSSLVSAKKVYKVRRVAHKYGVYAILGMNFVPSPSPLLTFGLALTRYPFTRLFFFLIAANVTKFLIILYFL